jgi:hypothetical protein
MFPMYFMGSEINGNPFAGGFGLLGNEFYNLDTLPDEVKEALERRKNEIESEEDVRSIVSEEMQRR